MDFSHVTRVCAVAKIAVPLNSLTRQDFVAYFNSNEADTESTAPSNSSDIAALCVQCGLFCAAVSESETGRKEGCRHYGYILERHLDISLRVCGSRGSGRETHLYNTESNIVDIVIAKDDSAVTSYSYLIQYKGADVSSALPNRTDPEERRRMPAARLHSGLTMHICSDRVSAAGAS